MHPVYPTVTDGVIGITVPIIPGIMPIQTYSSFLRLTKLCGTKVPESIMADLVPIRVRQVYGLDEFQALNYADLVHSTTTRRSRITESSWL